ncbi:MAG: hypothetical protein ACE5I3_14280 [Phycisphaerae bacterium]
MSERGSESVEFSAWAEAMRGEFEVFLRETGTAMKTDRGGSPTGEGNPQLPVVPEAALAA